MSPSGPGPRRAPGRGRRAFAATWWGQAWVRALEDSTLDAGRLSRGRTYARQGMVGPVTVAPGQVEAAVQGSRPRPYRSAIRAVLRSSRCRVNGDYRRPVRSAPRRSPITETPGRGSFA